MAPIWRYHSSARSRRPTSIKLVNTAIRSRWVPLFHLAVSLFWQVVTSRTNSWTIPTFSPYSVHPRRCAKRSGISGSWMTRSDSTRYFHVLTRSKPFSWSLYAYQEPPTRLPSPFPSFRRSNCCCYAAHFISFHFTATSFTWFTLAFHSLTLSLQCTYSAWVRAQRISTNSSYSDHQGHFWGSLGLVELPSSDSKLPLFLTFWACHIDQNQPFTMDRRTAIWF